MNAELHSLNKKEGFVEFWLSIPTYSPLGIDHSNWLINKLESVFIGVERFINSVISPKHTDSNVVNSAIGLQITWAWIWVLPWHPKLSV